MNEYGSPGITYRFCDVNTIWVVFISCYINHHIVNLQHYQQTRTGWYFDHALFTQLQINSLSHEKALIGSGAYSCINRVILDFWYSQSKCSYCVHLVHLHSIQCVNIYGPCIHAWTQTQRWKPRIYWSFIVK